VLDAAPPGGETDDTRAALFADLRKGEDVTKGMVHTLDVCHRQLVAGGVVTRHEVVVVVVVVVVLVVIVMDPTISNAP